jgi:energy-coupling factor transporter ATP-binding protein EcfA2
MRLTTLHVRFFKAFNYDYLRKFHKGAEPLPWELMEDDSWYPFVNVSLEEDITTVVGANESGKSQVLDAIEIALGQRAVGRTDFCRYSRFFLIDRVKRLPDFGATFADLTEPEASEIAKLTGWSGDDVAVTGFTLIRDGKGRTTVYIRENGEWTAHKLAAAAVRRLDGLVPKVFRLQSQLPLPNAVPLTFLSQEGDEKKKAVASSTSRKQRRQIIDKLATMSPGLAETTKTVTENAQKFVDLFIDRAERATDPHAVAKYQLADDLLVKITGIDREHFADLLDTIADERDGYVDGVEELINRSLATKLNFRRWWSQDTSFQLRVTVRESDVAFIVRDRTGTHYSFSERSGGLGYYLSYFVQYMRHDPLEDRSEILLMDEPDAYLSSQGQKDLLRIFDAFAAPDDGSNGCQVIYVTHSPFLIDKNHAERIRVIEKGEGDEGTRVVGDVSRNHYEPLRSAFGALVAETTFMGGCNLMVEGIGDQVLIAGMSRRLQANDAVPHTEYLNLNDLTIVPAGGASHVPYLAYLARGRDIEKPAVIVLLDSDTAGNDARKAIKKGGAYRRALVDDQLVLQIADDRAGLASDRPGGPIETEDLVPVEIAVAAVEIYAREYLGKDELTLDASQIKLDDGVFDGAAALLMAAVPDCEKVEKVGFARGVIAHLSRHARGEASISAESLNQLDTNFRALCKILGEMQRTAMREHSDVKLSDRIARIRDGFLDDHRTPPDKADVQVLFEEMQHALDNSRESEEVRAELRRLTDVHELGIDAATPVSDFEELKRDLQALQYRSRHLSQEDASNPSEEPVE